MTLGEQLVFDEIKRLIGNCAIKREILFQSAMKNAKKKKHLTSWASILSLLATGSLFPVILKSAGTPILQIIAAVCVFSASILNIILSNYLTPEDVANIFEASSKYFALSNKFHHLLQNPQTKESDLYSLLVEIQVDYEKLNGLYNKYDLYKLAKKNGLQLSAMSADGKVVYTYTTLLESDFYRYQNIYDLSEPGKIHESIARFKNVQVAVKSELERLQFELDELKKKSNGEAST